MSTEFNVSPFKIFVLITLEVNSKIIYDKETKHTLLITFTSLLIGPEAISVIVVTHRTTENSIDNVWPKLHDGLSC